MVLNCVFILILLVITNILDEEKVIFTSKILIDINLVLSFVDMRILER